MPRAMREAYRSKPENLPTRQRLSRRRRKVAEREGFEPPCRLPGKTLSRRPRYDHFGTSPFFYFARLLTRATVKQADRL